MKRIAFVAIFGWFLGSSPAEASELLKDFDTLGGNDVLLERARALNPDAKLSVVQDRIVDRRQRIEIGPELGSVLGGDSYTKTSTIGLNATYHITPHWSLGLKYSHAFNRLRPEGEYLINDVTATGQGMIPDIDFPKREGMLIGNWYPIYGKMNLYDLGVVHFDLYAILGAGRLELKSGSASTATAGGGIGLWVSRHVTTRLELRYQTYEAKRFSGSERMDTTVAGVQMGYLL